MEGILHATHWWLWAMPGFCLLPIWAMTLLYFCCYSVCLVFPRPFDWLAFLSMGGEICAFSLWGPISDLIQPLSHSIYALDSISLHLEDILLGACWLPVLPLVAIQAYSTPNFLVFGSAESLSYHTVSALLWFPLLWFHLGSDGLWTKWSPQQSLGT